METFYKPPLETQEVPEPIYSSGVQRSTRINIYHLANRALLFNHIADCDKSPNSKGGESYDWIMDGIHVVQVLSK